MRTEDSTLLILLVAVSLAFAWILWPFYGAILWAVVFATVFAPAHRRLLATMRQSPNWRPSRRCCLSWRLRFSH